MDIEQCASDLLTGARGALAGRTRDLDKVLVTVPAQQLEQVCEAALNPPQEPASPGTDLKT